MEIEKFNIGDSAIKVSPSGIVIETIIDKEELRSMKDSIERGKYQRYHKQK